MKITHITSAHPRHDTRIFIKECASLAKAGNIVHLIVADGKGDDTKKGVQILDAGSAGKGRFDRMTGTVKRVFNRAVSTKAQIYHLHDPELLRLIPKLLKHGKVIYDAHEDLPRQIMGKHWIPKPLRRAVSFISEKVENHYAQKVSGIVTATPFIADRFCKINRNVANINNYPLLDEFAHIERKPSDERLVCYIGGITAGRGIFEMVRAMELVDGKLLLAGNFSNPVERKKAQKLPDWEKVIELGFCDREKVREILASAKIGLVVLHPTINYVDALPVKLFEYMAAGLPVIASDFTLWREILDTARCGKCVNPLNAEEIARAINWMLDHPEEANKMGKAGKVAIKDRFNWEAEEKKMLEFYHHMS